jgi:hypothetical protein
MTSLPEEPEWYIEPKKILEGPTKQQSFELLLSKHQIKQFNFFV